MTYQNKIEASLAERMARTPGKTLPVLIEMREQPEAPPTLDRQAELEALSNQAQASREGVLEHLHQLGIRCEQIETFSIVNAIATSLLSDQIRAMAQRSDVKFIRYNGQANVAL